MEAYIPDADDRKQAITEFFTQNGQQFLPLLELLVDAKQQLHDFTHAVGVAAIEGLLELSARQLAGPPHPGKAAPAPAASKHGGVRRHGQQNGVVVMGKSKLRVKRPRLRSVPDEQGRTLEVQPPAYTALKQDPKLAERMLDVALGGGISTRKYRKILDQTAGVVGVSKSAVSRALKKAMTTALEQVKARVIPGADILVVYIDGFVVGSTHVIGAIGVKNGPGRAGRRQRESDRGDGPADGPAGPGPECRHPPALCARWRQGPAQCRGWGLWQARGGATMPESQATECNGSSAGEAAGPRQAGAACGL